MNEKLQILTDYYPDEEFLSADGLEDAIIGVCGEKLVYSQAKVLDILVKRDGMTDEEALEHFDFNIEGSYMGEKTPIWVDDLMFYDWGEDG